MAVPQYQYGKGIYDSYLNDRSTRASTKESELRAELNKLKIAQEPERHKEEMQKSESTRWLNNIRGNDIPKRTAIAQANLEVNQRKNSPYQLAVLAQNRLASAALANERAKHYGAEVGLKSGRLDLDREKHSLNKEINSPDQLEAKKTGVLARALFHGRSQAGKTQAEQYLAELGAKPGFPAINDVLPMLGFQNPNAQKQPDNPNAQAPQEQGAPQEPQAAQNFLDILTGNKQQPQQPQMKQAPDPSFQGEISDEFAKARQKAINNPVAENRTKAITNIEETVGFMDKVANNAFSYSGAKGKVKKLGQDIYKQLPFVDTPQGIMDFDEFKQQRDLLSSQIRFAFGESITPEMHKILNDLSYDDSWNTTPQQADNRWKKLKRTLATEMHTIRRGLVGTSVYRGKPETENEKKTIAPNPHAEGDKKSNMRVGTKGESIKQAMKENPGMTKEEAEFAWSEGEL